MGTAITILMVLSIISFYGLIIYMLKKMKEKEQDIYDLIRDTRYSVNQHVAVTNEKIEKLKQLIEDYKKECKCEKPKKKVTKAKKKEK